MNTKTWRLSCLMLVTAHAAPAQSSSQTVIPGVIASGAKVELIRDGFQGLEGPVGTSDGGLLFNDIPTSRTFKLTSDGSIALWRDSTGRANGQFLLPDGSLLVAEAGLRRLVALSPTRQVTVLAAQANGTPLRAPNDVMPDQRGGIYFTDPGVRPTPSTLPKESGNLLYRRADGEVIVLDSMIRRPNGLTLSLDGKTLYVDNTEGLDVYAFDVLSDGRLANRRVFATLLEPEASVEGQRSRADGMTIDSQGRLYITTSAGVQVLDSRGRHLGIIRLPAPAIARNAAFSGPEGRTLYLTALEGLYRVDLLSQRPPGRSK